MLGAVHIQIPGDSAALMARLQELERCVLGRAARLVVVDSVAALARVGFGRDETAQRQRQLGQQAAALKAVAERCRCVVVVTNQVTTQFGGGGGGGANSRPAESRLAAALGTQWAHAVNTRLVLEALPSGERALKVAKSPLSPPLAFGFEARVFGGRGGV